MTDARSSSTVSTPIQGRNDGFGVLDKSVEIMLQVVSCRRVPPYQWVKLSVIPMFGDVVDVAAARYNADSNNAVICHDAHFRCYEDLYTRGTVEHIWPVKRKHDNTSAGAYLY